MGIFELFKLFKPLPLINNSNSLSEIKAKYTLRLTFSNENEHLITILNFNFY